jgi:tetratricopeptide (TPR) repeat protein
MRNQNSIKTFICGFISFVVLVLFSCNGLFSQSAHKCNLEGDQHYDRTDYPSAEINYRKALEEESGSKSYYNLGNTLLNQNRNEEAQDAYEKSLNRVKDPVILGKIHYNKGNTLYKMGKFEESIKSYKETLRLNPYDQDARKNLALAKEKLKNSSKEKQKNQNKNNNQDQKKDNKDKSNTEKNKDQSQEQKNSAEQKRKDQNTNQIPKSEYENLLKSIEEGENEIHKKLFKGRTKTQKRQKDW